MQTPDATVWSSIIEHADQSRLTVREFADSHGLDPDTLMWWKQKLTSQQNLTSRDGDVFTEVVIGDPDPEPAGLRVYVGDALVLVDRGSDLLLLRQLVEVLS